MIKAIHLPIGVLKDSEEKTIGHTYTLVYVDSRKKYGKISGKELIKKYSKKPKRIRYKNSKTKQ